MIYQAHRGVSSEAPENTLPAIELAILQGYKSIEMDVSATKDGALVLMHDSKINRTARRTDGTEINTPTPLANITYEELCKYDFGIYFSKKYAGTKAPLFEDVLKRCAKDGINVKVDSKYTRLSLKLKLKLFKLLNSYKDIITLTCGTLHDVLFAHCFLPDIKYSYEGKITDVALKVLSKVISKDKLTFWIPLKNELTGWVRVEYASEALVAKVKNYGKLGIWILTKEDELSVAASLGADAIETPGNLKPPINAGVIADMHSHSNHSHDCHVPMRTMWESANKVGVKFLAETDHCDVFRWQNEDIFTRVLESFAEASEINATKKPLQTTLLKGVEIGEGFWYPEINEKVHKLLPYDVIIGSVHGVKRENVADSSYSIIDFSATPQEEIQAFLGAYFRDMKKLTESTDFDILAHLTCPLKYIVGKYNRKVDLTPFTPDIEYIFKFIIAHGIALEINTSAYATLNDFMPCRDIIKKYKALGGYMITLGGDAHKEQNVATNFDLALQFLKEEGFKYIFRFQNRQPIQCLIK